MVIEFGLPEGDARELLAEYNRTKCSPPWDERDLETKLRSALNMAATKPGEVGRLISQDRSSYSGPAVAPRPVSTGPGKPATAPVAVPVRPEEPARTGRTLFEVTRFGSGAKRARAHTLRTLTSYSLRIEEKGSSLNVRSGGGVSDPSEASGVAPGAESSCAEASEASAPKQEARAVTPGVLAASEPSAPSAATFAGKQSGKGNLGTAVAALAQDGLAEGTVVTWIGAGGNIVRFGRDGRPRKFGTIKE
jgi:hypothetical protein